MHNEIKNLPDEVQDILVTVSRVAASLDSRIYIVGGVVRDFLLKRNVTDLDIVVEGDAIRLAQEVAENIGAEFKRHHAFGTATITLGSNKIDFATARKEVYPKPGALPKVEPADMHNDMMRRDFTINAMAISLNHMDYGRLIDHHGGVNDLHAHTIKILHDKSFIDDPTRILRAIRFEQRFGFKLERKTLQALNDAVKAKAFETVHPHRLRDEIILILKEPRPFEYIKRVEEVVGWGVIIGDKKLKLSKDELILLHNIETTMHDEGFRLSRFRSLDAWLIYLMAILVKLDIKAIKRFVETFDFKKGERIRLITAKEYLNTVKKISGEVKPHVIYRILNPLSFETILFLYIYTGDGTVRKNIENFMTTMVNAKLKVGGADLKAIHVKPEALFGKILDNLLDAKLDKGFSTRQEEMVEAGRIYAKMSKGK